MNALKNAHPTTKMLVTFFLIYFIAKLMRSDR